MNTPAEPEQFLSLAQEFPVIDVRSPAEFAQGHIPGAHNIPLFDNEERAKVGTAYKRIGRQEAIKIGMELVGPKMGAFVRQAEEMAARGNPGTSPTLLVHCWRGGMRSSSFAHLLNVYGFRTHTLVKGYKAYRNFVLQSFEREVRLFILGGETGSGKTEILKKIKKAGELVVDLEKIASHKGSAFGSLGEKPQPTQEQFENELSSRFAEVLRMRKPAQRIWMEDESRNIGTCQLPPALWEKMKQAPIIRVNVPKEDRIERLMNDYGKCSEEELAACLKKIEKRLGPQHAKHALEELKKGNLRACADIALIYYDKAYNYQHESRNFKDVFPVECKNADADQNAEAVMEFARQKFKKEYA